MKNRIKKFLEMENISPSKFADEIGVQRSSISHILSGRNNPSLELIQKILTRFDYLNAEWLITGKGEMFKPKRHPTLFDDIYMQTNTSDKKNENKQVKNEKIDEISEHASVKKQNSNSLHNVTNQISENIRIKKIILLYENGKAEVFDV